MQPYFEIILQNKIYIQRTPNSKVIEFDLNGTKLNSYEELPNDIQEIIYIIINMENHPKDHFDYEETNGEITINHINKIDVPYIKIPSHIEGYPVTKINSYAATELSNTLEQLHLPDTLLYFGEGAFCYLNALKKINIPPCVKHIGPNCFSDCINLTDINLEHIEKIGLCAFKNCKSLKSINLKSIKTLISYAFSGCEKLSNVEIGNNLKIIPQSTFKNCSIEEIALPDSIEIIKQEAFSNCKLKKFIGPKNLISIDDYAFTNNNIEEVRLSNKTIAVGNHSFLNNPIKIYESKNTKYHIRTQEER